MEPTARELRDQFGKGLDKLLSAMSIAIIGASQREGRVNGAIRNLRDLGFKGRIYPVNPKYETVMELPCYPNLRAIPEPVDMVVVGIPSRAVLPILEEAHDCGIGAAVIISSGFSEAGGDGASLQKGLSECVARTGMLICGPNCVGAINFNAPSAGYYSASPKDCVAGDLAVVSQSGTIIVALVRGDRPAGFSYLISSGNEVGVSSAEYIRHFVDDPNTRIIGTFLEGINKPDLFVEAAEAAREAGKPIIAMKTGRSELGSAASAAHTGSLAGSFEVHRAVFRQLGIVQCDDIDEWIEAIELFRHSPVPKAAGIGLIGVSGGENSLVLDQLADNSLDVPPLSEAGARTLRGALPEFARPANPIDTSGGLGDDPSIYRRCLDVLAAEPDIGIIVVSQDSPAFFDRLAAEALVQVAAESDKCFIFLNNISRPASPEVQKILREGGVAYVQGLRAGVKAIGAYVDYYLNQRRRAAPPRIDEARRAKARALLSGHGRIVTEDAGKELLRLFGLPVVEERVAADAAEAAHAAGELGFPVVAKVVSPDISHKLDAGGVRLDLNSAEEVSQAVDAMRESVAAHAPSARIQGFAVQKMVPRGIEVILGMKRDEQFGQFLLFGLGGTFVEVIRSFAMRLCPVSDDDARQMIEEAKVLADYVKKVAPDFDMKSAVAPLITGFSTLCAELEDDVEEIDINPVILDPRSGAAVAVDALFIRRSTEAESGSETAVGMRGELTQTV
jgi:acetate---CoA ligase (ADP-forming)